MDSGGSITLLVESGISNGSSYKSEIAKIVTIGRDPTCELILKDRGLSRLHCKLHFDSPDWILEDLDSTNGTFLNGDQVKTLPSIKTIVRNGDKIAVGKVSMGVCIQPESDEKTEVLSPLQVPRDGFNSTRFFSPDDNATNANENPMRKNRTVIRQPSSQVSSTPKGKQANGKSSQVNNIPNEKSELDNRYLCPELDIDSPQERKTFRNFRLLKKIGEGGMGDVYLAEDSQSVKLAIKFISPNAEQNAADRLRFLREMEITFKLSHPAVIRCTEYGEENGRLFFVMDYCNGGNLRELLDRVGKLNFRRAVRLLDRLLAGLEQAHLKGIVHRDLKPSNILLHREKDGTYLPKIGDFGLAKNYLQAGESGMTMNGAIGGSWNFMPFEQLTNFRFVTPASDIWSLSAIIYECLTLKQPRPVIPGADPIRTILESDVVTISELIPDIHAGFASLLMKGLQKDDKKRFENATKMRDALTKVAKSAGVPL